MAHLATHTVGMLRHDTLGSDLAEWTLGFDVYRDVVSSFLDKGTAQQPKDDVQGPVADDASYLTAGLFSADVQLLIGIDNPANED